jgi:hypothetical protein
VLLASAVRLLSRFAPAAVLGLSCDPPRSALAHPGMRFVPEEEVDAALDACSLLVIVGDLSHPVRLAKSAAHLVRAKWARVPVALVAVRLQRPGEPERGGTTAAAADPAGARAQGVFLPLLAQAESLSACDRASARSLAALCGKRVETAAPLELLFELESPPPGAGWTICLAAEVLAAGAGRGLLESLGRVSTAGEARVVVLSIAGSEPPHPFERRVPADWQAWLREAVACDVLIDAADSTLLHVGAAHGVRPLALRPGSRTADLHARLGLGALVLPWDAEPEAFSAALQHARSLAPEAVRARCTPLGSVAWRALGPLSEATRSRSLQLQGLPSEALALVTAAREARALGGPQLRHASAARGGEGSA